MSNPITIAQLTQYLESIAPLSYQEGYDNAGLIVGNPHTPIKGVLLCLDSTEAVIEEAIATGCNLVIAHHPIVFKGLKRLNGSNYVERTVLKAIKNDIAIYAIHTNLDNVYHQGVNAKIAERIGLQNTRILAPKQNQEQIQFTVPNALQTEITNTLLELGHSEKYFASGSSDGQHIQYTITLPANQIFALQRALNHIPNTSVSIFPVTTPDEFTGAGMIGELAEPLEESAFLRQLKEKMQVGCIKYTTPLGKPVRKVAVCGGAGGFLLKDAIRQGADIFITSDYKYHEFFDADGKIIIADIGHYESEQFTIDLLYEIISEKFSNFAVRCTKTNTNPVRYL